MRTLILGTTLLFLCCITNKGSYDEFIRNYKGDGKAQLKTCYNLVIFGFEWVDIALPNFMLSKKTEVEYKIGILPKEFNDREIWVILKIQDANYSDALLKGIAELNIFRNDSVYFSAKDKLENFNHSKSYQGYHGFSYFGYNMQTKSYDTLSKMKVENQNASWKVNFGYQNDSLGTKEIDAHIFLQCGECATL